MSAPLTDDAALSVIIQAIMKLSGMTTDDAKARLAVELSSTHFHEGKTSPEIPWNDVQAIRSYNYHAKHDQPPLLQVPLYASQGFNKHYHSSDFDGGMIPGVNGIHNHLDNLHGGGFAYAVFYPSSGAPMAAWEK
jgi:hypothetical protein